MILAIAKWCAIGILTIAWMELMPFVLLALIFYWIGKPKRKRS